MPAGFEKRLVVVWLALSAMTIAQLGFASGDGQDALRPNAAITVSAIVIALVKVRIIVREFMEVRHAPASLRRLMDLWVVFTGVSLLGCYFVGMA
ncbi:MAG: cytochrome C oxidase subunit IV family protein [Phycisphaerales bacterium]